MTEPVIYNKQGHVVTITLNQPETRNAISGDDMIASVEDVAKRVNSDKDVRAVILTGAGKGFSSGGNVKHMRDKEGMFAGNAFGLREGYREGIQRIPRAMYEIEVPMIAAVNGAAIGAGCDLAMMCDLRVASDTAVFAESFIKVGLIPGDGGAWFLPRVIGFAKASEMALTGDAINAAKALEWGMVNQVVSPEELMVAANKLAERVACNPPAALRMTKKLLREAQHQRLDSLLELSAAYQSIAHQMDDHQEAVAAMLEKRKPNFTGC